MHENGLFYHQQLMQSSQHGFPGYQQVKHHCQAVQVFGQLEVLEVLVQFLPEACQCLYCFLNPVNSKNLRAKVLHGNHHYVDYDLQSKMFVMCVKGCQLFAKDQWLTQCTPLQVTHVNNKVIQHFHLIFIRKFVVCCIYSFLMSKISLLLSCAFSFLL